MTGKVRAMNNVSAVILTTTRTALNARAFGGADDQQPGDRAGDQDGGHVDPAADLKRLGHLGRGCGAEQKLDLGHQCVGVADGDGEVHTQSVQQARRMIGPADRDGAGAHGIFQDQRPAHHPGHHLADHGVGIGVGGARDRHHRGQFGIAQRRDRADKARDHEGQHHARAGLLRRLGGQHEDAGADHRADAQQGQLERPQRAVQRPFSRPSPGWRPAT